MTTATYNQISERRIRNNRLKRCRQIRRNIRLMVFTLLCILCFSALFFSVKAKAQAFDANISYKYYKNVMVASGDSLWNYAKQYADEEHYRSYDSYVNEVITMNHLKNEDLTYGSYIILPYYSSEFVAD